MTTFQSDMCSEFKRYATFCSFQPPPGIWPLQLAKAGFCRSGICEPGQVICFACGLQLDVKNLTKQPVMEVHRRLAPDCPFVLGSANNQPVTATDTNSALEWLHRNYVVGNLQQNDEPMNLSQSLPYITDALSFYTSIDDGPKSLPNFQQTLLDHELMPMFSSLENLEEPELHSLPMDFVDGFANATLNSVSSAALFQGGNFSQPDLYAIPGEILVADGDPAGIEGTYQEPTMLETHIASYSAPQQNMIAESQNQFGVERKLTFGDLGIIVQRPKKQELATFHKRLEGFKSWTNYNLSQTKEAIAEAGFYYAGYSDCCRCFYCGGGLKNWEPEDDPWVEHARWFKDCPYVLTSKGQDFVNIVQSMARTRTSILLSDVEKELKEITASQNNETNDLQIDDDFCPPSSCNKELEILKSENEQLKRPDTCKICLDEEVGVLYVPCGHLVTCATCAPTVQRCPVCRETIHGQIRVRRGDC